MKKKLMAMAICAVMALSLAGCKEKKLSNDYITINKYEGLEITKVEKEEITDESVENEINGNLTMGQTTEEVTDRAAQLGDVVNIDYLGSFDGEAFEGGSAEGMDLTLGSGSFIGATDDYAGFEDQIVGHNTGEEFDITVQFPDPYTNNEDYSGKVANFHIKLNTISEVITPELTDEWVAENSETSKTVDEYREEIRNMLQENSETTWKTTMQNAVMEAFINEVEVKKLPQDRVDEQYAMIEENYKSMAEAYGMEFTDFLTNMGMDEESFAKRAKEVAEDGVKRSIACELLAEKTGLTPTDEEYEQRTAEYAEEYGYEDVESFKEQFSDSVIKDAVLQEKVVNYLLEKCVQVEPTEDDSAETETEE